MIYAVLGVTVVALIALLRLLDRHRTPTRMMKWIIWILLVQTVAVAIIVFLGYQF